jgi:trehalose 2-sulfotransferase
MTPSAYTIAMLPRTGSTALCSLLSQTQRLGFPDEYLNPRGPVQHWMKQLSTSDFDDYLAAIRRERATANGVFGMKTTFDDFSPHVDALKRHGLFGDSPFIYLTRDDIPAQAVSEFIAEESGVWHRDGSGNVYQSVATKDVADVEFDEQRISNIAGRFIQMQERWEEFFSRHRIEPLRISYEDLHSDADSVVRAIAGHVEVDWTGSLSLDHAATSVLRDSRSTEWSERIRTSMK